MQANNVDLFLATKGKCLPAVRLPAIREQLLAMDESKAIIVQSAELKDPTTMLIISIFLGVLGVYRFMLKQVGMGILKLLTGGVCGILSIIDWITIQKKTREFNYNTLMTTLALDPAYVATAPLPVTATIPETIAASVGDVSAEQQLSVSDEQSNPQTSGGAAFVPAPVYIPSVKSESGAMKSLPVFLKAFFKQPFTAVVASPLNLPDGLILAGIHAVVFAIFSLLLLGGAGQLGYLLGFGYGGGAKLFFSALILSAVGTAALSALHLIFGKVVFKGELDGGFKKLLPRVVATEAPLIAATVLAIVFNFVFPAFSVLLLAFGIISAIALSSAVFTGEMKLTHDKGVFASIFTYTVQVVVLYILFTILF
jgi:TM2 domain-containing membrane protein YozV